MISLMEVIAQSFIESHELLKVRPKVRNAKEGKRIAVCIAVPTKSTPNN